MKVLEKGSGWKIEERCTGIGNGGGGCGAKLLVETEDIFLTHDYDIGGDHDMYYTFQCPECGVQTNLYKFDVPKHIRIKLLTDYRNSKIMRR